MKWGALEFGSHKIIVESCKYFLVFVRVHIFCEIAVDGNVNLTMSQSFVSKYWESGRWLFGISSEMLPAPFPFRQNPPPLTKSGKIPNQSEWRQGN